MQRLSESADEILNLYNYFNGAIIFDKNAIAVYYYNNRPDINHLTEEDVVGKQLFQIYPELEPEDSTIMEALNFGTTTSNMAQKIKTYQGQILNEINTTIPIIENGEIIGAVEVSKYNLSNNDLGNIFITPIITDKHRELFKTDDIISTSPKMDLVKKLIGKVSKTNSSVLIYGESGTGKEMVAESIHTASKRSKYRFVSQNCAAIPSTLLESTLFGTAKGSFTGAEDRCGLLELADKGTLFLDEINNMDLGLQAKILKAIEEQKITRVGEYEPREVDVRIIAATNMEPKQLIKSNRLRQDLYYRLRVVEIDLPPLSERAGDIQCLINFFIKKYNKIMGKSIVGVDKSVEAALLNYTWPGNVRELNNLIEGAFNFTDGPLIHLKDIGWEVAEGYCGVNEENFYGLTLTDGKGLKELTREYERNVIIDTINKYANINDALAELGLTRQNLNHKIKQYKLENFFNNDK